jgi:hypothetical protein
MTRVTLTIRGLDRDLLKQARINASNRGIRISDWLNEAISAKIIEEFGPHNLDDVAESTDVDGVFRVDKGTVKVGSDYIIKGRYLCAAGRKGDEEVITYKSPDTIHKMGYQVFWVR